MKKIIILIFTVLTVSTIFTACSGELNSDKISDENAFFTEISSKNFQSEKTSEELEEEIKAIYNEEKSIMFSLEDNTSFEKDNYRVAIYKFVDREFSNRTYILCRFKDDKVIGYIRLDENILIEALNAPEPLTLNSIKLNRSNADLSHIEFTSVHSDACSFTANFDDGSFEYSMKDVETDYIYLKSLSEERQKEELVDRYILPLAEAGFIGNYYRETDFITKMLDYYGYNHRSLSATETDSDGREFSFVDKATVLEYLEKHFYGVDSFVYECNERYNPEKDAFKIYCSKDKKIYPYTITVDDYYFSNSFMRIDYTITDNGTLVAKETCDFNRINGYYGFVSCYDYEIISDDEQTAQRYTLSLGDSEGGGDSWMSDVILTDIQTGRTKNLGREAFSDSVSDYGFFSNGDVYVMNYTGLTVFDKNMDNPKPIFTTKTNFPCTLRGEKVTEDGAERFMLAIRRDPVTFEYIVIYCEFIIDEEYSKNYINDFQMSCNYRIGVLDKTGKLKKSWDTGVPVMFSVFGFENTYMKKVGDNEYEMFVRYKNTPRLSGRFNIEIETYIPIRQFVLNW